MKNSWNKLKYFLDMSKVVQSSELMLITKVNSLEFLHANIFNKKYTNIGPNTHIKLLCSG